MIRIANAVIGGGRRKIMAQRPVECGIPIANPGDRCVHLEQAMPIARTA
jgi:hypothetical protein